MSTIVDAISTELHEILVKKKARQSYQTLIKHLFTVNF
jgi:hypothetical protein